MTKSRTYNEIRFISLKIKQVYGELELYYKESLFYKWMKTIGLI